MSESSNTQAGDDATKTLDSTTRHRLLQDRQRRQIIDVLASGCGSLTLTELADVLTRRSHDLYSEISGDCDTVVVRLHHVHLPMLADAGLLDYDHESNHVHPRPRRIDQVVH